MAATYDELKDQKLEQHVEAVYKEIMVMSTVDLRHLLIKLMGKDAMQLDIVRRAEIGAIRMKLD